MSPPLEWPGLHCAKELCARETKVSGKWENRSKKYRLEQAGKQVLGTDVISEESFDLDPLPSFATADLSVWFAWVRVLVDQIVDQHHGQHVLAAEKVESQPSTEAPKKSKSTYGVDFHARGRAQGRSGGRCIETSFGPSERHVST